MNSITVKWLAPTDRRGSRVVARSVTGHRVIVNWDYSISGDENSDRAAIMLANKLEWNKGKNITLVRGYHASHEYVYLILDKSTRTINIQSSEGSGNEGKI